MYSAALVVPNLTVGLDLGDRVSRVCEVNAAGQVVKRSSVSTTPVMIDGYFGGRERCRVVMEVGTHSPWVSRRIQALGHEVMVANPSAMYGKGHRRNRNDEKDAEFLARQGRADPTLLHPIHHRGAEVQAHLVLLRSRDGLVRSRTKLVNLVRGSVKAMGGRIGRCSAEAFASRAVAQIPSELRMALTPLLEVISDLTMRIRQMDRQIEQVIEDHYPEAQLVQQIKGVGPVTALCFVLLVEDPDRFEQSRDVGPYFGLVSKLDESSDSKPQLRITKSGDEMGRRLLVSAAQYILGPHGPECDLRAHGQRIAERGGKNAKKRAAVAVARKLAVLMHRLWVGQAVYDPHHLAKKQAVAA